MSHTIRAHSRNGARWEFNHGGAGSGWLNGESYVVPVVDEGLRQVGGAGPSSCHITGLAAPGCVVHGSDGRALEQTRRVDGRRGLRPAQGILARRAVRRRGKATLSSGNAVVGLVLVGVCNLVLALNTWSRRELWDSDRELMPKWVALMNGRAALNYQLAAAVFLFGLAIVLT
jgi:hypothetical protein